MREPIPEIAQAVKYWMPDATEEEQKRATVNLRRYLAVVYQIYLRFEREGKFPLPPMDDDEFEDETSSSKNLTNS